jgi:transposase
MSRVEQFERIRRDRRLEGLSIRTLARRHKVHRRIVRQALASAIPPRRVVPDRPSPVFGPYEGIVRRWLIEDKSAPKKQRHTARRVWQRLVAEYGADIAESTVRERVRELREEIADPPEAMIPQLHAPGEEAEVDFGELWAYVAGVYVKLWLFSLRLSASGRAFHRVYATQAQEAFFSGHVHAFEAMGGIPLRIRYDNLKPAVARVLFGRDRIESERFVAFRSHYGFDSFYCRPGREGAHEKGGVEQDIGWFRRNHLVPVPRVGSLGELNVLLDRYDSEDLTRVIEGHRATIGAEFGSEQPFLSALPSERFDCARELKVRVDHKARVCVRQCRYSVPVSLVGRRLLVRLGATDLEILSGGQIVASHERLVQRGSESLVLDHYLETLIRKPGALPSSVPLAQARQAGSFTCDHERYWAAARRGLGDSLGTKALIEVLLLHRTLRMDAIRSAICAVLDAGIVAPEAVAIEARSQAGRHLAKVIAIGEASGGSPRIDITRYDRPPPDLARYDGLLGDKSAPQMPRETPQEVLGDEAEGLVAGSFR